MNRDLTEFNRIKKERLKEIGRCELCGSKRGLELHHCIPKSLGGEDTEDNLVLVCSKCHSALTPKSTLIRLGISKINPHNFETRAYMYDFYREAIEGGYGLDAIECFNAVMVNSAEADNERGTYSAKDCKDLWECYVLGGKPKKW